MIILCKLNYEHNNLSGVELKNEYLICPSFCFTVTQAVECGANNCNVVGLSPREM